MHHEDTIRLSGPFRLHDSLGRTWDIGGIRIFDEGYGIIDVYVDFSASMEGEPLHEDVQVIRQILSRLRTLGYSGPDFGPGDPGLQDDRLIVLEAPEAFAAFAASWGWKNLAEEYADEYEEASMPQERLNDSGARDVFDALMLKLRGKP